MTTDQLFHEALASRQPLRDLRSVLRGLLANGHSRDAVVEDLEGFRERLRTEDRDAAEDSVLDVMDFVVGWCAPHIRL